LLSLYFAGLWLVQALQIHINCVSLTGGHRASGERAKVVVVVVTKSEITLVPVKLCRCCSSYVPALTSAKLVWYASGSCQTFNRSHTRVVRNKISRGVAPVARELK
jgi:hypothetical protein